MNQAGLANPPQRTRPTADMLDVLCVDQGTRRGKFPVSSADEVTGDVHLADVSPCTHTSFRHVGPGRLNRVFDSPPRRSTLRCSTNSRKLLLRRPKRLSFPCTAPDSKAGTNVVKETLRLHPPFDYFDAGRQGRSSRSRASRSMDGGLRGPHLPAISNRIPEDFPEPRLRFRPEPLRQSPEQGRPPSNRWTWIPFGAGPAPFCVGAAFRARLQIKAIFSVSVARV